MKRLLQGLALLQVFLVIALSVRVVRVWTTPMPEVTEIPDLPAKTSLPPPKLVPKISPAVTESVVEHDLFDDQRGQGIDDIIVEGTPVPPVPPPSTVKLMGVMFVGSEPVGILLDTNVKPEQQAVRKGEMFGEYEVGDISKSGLLLLGGEGQQFQIPLRIEATGGAAMAGAPAPPAPRTPPGTAARPAPAARPAAVRPAVGARADNAAPDADQKAMTARERAQAIAQRNAELRKSGNQRTAPAAEAAEKQADAAPDPVQARLEALRQLREAAKSR